MLATAHAHDALYLLLVLITAGLILGGAWVAFTGRVLAGVAVAVIGLIFAVVFLA